VTFPAFAKLNLALDVLGVRPDGYHELLSVMQAIDLHDVITLRPAAAASVSGNIPLPAGADNLALAAALLFKAKTGLPVRQPEIYIEKHIPPGAGLGGGSADAAAVLRALRDSLRPDIADETLAGWGLALGSDVPFCVHGGAALARGRGELLTPLPALPPCHIVVCAPGEPMSTAEAYALIDKTAANQRPDVMGLAEALQAGDLPGAARRAGNVFSGPVGELIPAVPRIKAALLAAGALGAAMSGSGSAVFGLFDNPRAAREALSRLREDYPACFVCRPLSALPPRSRPCTQPP
jgi:4-diphosphocytidyl-2-C-methyl-D-erythritol kinase